MGIGVVLIFYAVALSIAAAIGAVVLGGLAYLLTRGAVAGRKRAVIISALSPFACAAFAGVWFVLYAAINYTIFHRDPGLGDSWETPLPNGYALMMIDVTDQGTVYNPRTQSGFDSVANQKDTISGVRQLQVSGHRIFGASDSGYVGRIGQDSTFADTWFELDTDKGVPIEFKSLDALRHHATAEGVVLNLRSVDDVYREYRFTWFDYAAATLLFLVPACGLFLLVRWVWRIRQLAVLARK